MHTHTTRRAYATLHTFEKSGGRSCASEGSETAEHASSHSPVSVGLPPQPKEFKRFIRRGSQEFDSLAARLAKTQTGLLTRVVCNRMRIACMEPWYGSCFRHSDAVPGRQPTVHTHARRLVRVVEPCGSDGSRPGRRFTPYIVGARLLAASCCDDRGRYSSWLTAFDARLSCRYI